MDEHDPDYAIEPFPTKPTGFIRGLIGVLIGASLLALAIWMGDTVRTSREDAGAIQYRIDDPERELVYLADPTGDVRVLNVRGGIYELTRLHDPQRHGVRHMELDRSRHQLRIETDDADYIYDTRNFALLERRVEVAARAMSAAKSD